MAATKGVSGLACIKCGEVDSVLLYAYDVETFSCNECKEEFEAKEVQEVMDGWKRMLDWIAQAPVIDGQDDGRQLLAECVQG